MLEHLPGPSQGFRSVCLGELFTLAQDPVWLFDNTKELGDFS